jgi:histidyl-tRNA synthetase
MSTKNKAKKVANRRPPVSRTRRGAKPRVSKSSSKPGKSQSLKKITRPLGMKDIMASDYKSLDPVLKKVRETAANYSFKKIETPILEDMILYKKFFDKNKAKSLFSLEPRGTERLAMRHDLVHGIIRGFIEHGGLSNLDRPAKFFSLGPVFRQERVKGGVYRQFNQFNFSIINDNKPTTDSFLIFLIYNIFKELQIDVQIQVNSLGDFDCQKEFINKFSKFIKERGRRSRLCNDCKKNIPKNPALLLSCQEESCLKVRNDMPQIVEFLSEESNSRFYKTMDFLDELDVNYNFNPYLVSDLNYYNDLIFEVWPIEKNGELNHKLALGRGGRYDNAFSGLAEKGVPMVGFSGGIERILIKAKEKNIFTEKKDNIIFVAQVALEAKSNTMFLFKELLSKGFNVKQAFHLDSLKDQLEEARNMSSKTILILGKKELNEETILFRDMESGVQETIARKDLISRLEKNFS